MNDPVRAFLAVFRLDPEKCKIEAVRLLGSGYNGSGERVYRFVAIVTCPSVLPDVRDVVMDPGDFTRLRNNVRMRLKDAGGVHAKRKIAWETTDKKTGKKKKKSFDFGAELSPQNVLGFEVVDGVYYIKVECYGLFYA